MIYKLEYKRIIILLAIGLMILIMLLWHKQETTNKVVPRKANFVLNRIEWRKNNV